MEATRTPQSVLAFTLQFVLSPALKIFKRWIVVYQTQRSPPMFCFLAQHSLLDRCSIHQLYSLLNSWLAKNACQYIDLNHALSLLELVVTMPIRIP